MYDKCYKMYMVKEEVFDENWAKACTFIYEICCSKYMQVVLKELPKFETHVINDLFVGESLEFDRYVFINQFTFQ